MAIKFPSLKIFSNADAKTRVFLVFATISAASLIIFLLVRYFGGEAEAPSGTKVATAPSSLQSVPGAQMSPEFYRAVVQANAQAAQQAQITGGSAVPTLINIPGQQAGFPQQTNCIICPSDDNVDVANDINELLKAGKLSQEDANHLLELAKNNVSVDEYAAALNELVRQGKLTPEQARMLLAKYKKQHANNAINESGKVMDEMIKAGQLPLEVANQLLALQRSGISPADYAAELNRLVREGKLTPAQATQLLAQYTQQQQREQAKKGVFALQQMAKSGAITPDVANTLKGLQERNAPVAQYESQLNSLVAAGKMTPAAAAKLLDLYKTQRAGIGSLGTLNALVGQEEASAADLLNDMVSKNKISPDVSQGLLALQQKGVSPEAYQAALNQLIQAKKLSPEDAQKLLASYQKLAALRAQANRLAEMQGNNATPNEYAAELQRAVDAGLLSSNAAADLYQQYRAITTPVPAGGAAPGVEANIPKEFAQIQERAAATNVQEGVEFKQPPPAVPSPPLSDASCRSCCAR